MKLNIFWLALCATLSACAQASTIQTSQDTAIVQASAAPACGGIGAARVAQKQAAIATINAGYDRYMIMGAQAANNVQTYQAPGSYNTSGFVSGGYLHTTTVYQPGPMITSGSHDQSFAIKMFKTGQPYADQAIDARAALGPKWPEIVRDGIITCTD